MRIEEEKEMRSDCERCKYAEFDYEEYYGGYRKYFVCGCRKDLDYFEDNECEEYSEDLSYYELD